MAFFFDEILDLAYEAREYPSLRMLCNVWNETKPFVGLRVLVATPVFRNTMLEYRALMTGGAELYVGKSTAVPFDEGIIAFLRKNGMEILEPEDVLALESDGEFMDLILDCAGQFSACHPRYGFVELTRSGVHLFEKCDLPVYVADSGMVKRIETSLGTGDGYVRALEIFGYSSLEGKNFVVFGSGKVGCGIVLQLLRRGGHVHVVTDTSVGVNGFIASNGIPLTDFRDVDSVVSLICAADFVVSATGVKDALENTRIAEAILESKAVVSNMGVEDEFGDSVPESRVLAGKRPLNFMLDEPTHLKYIDASLALHASLGELLLQEEPFVGTRNPPDDLERRILLATIQEGVISSEVCELLGLASSDL